MGKLTTFWVFAAGLASFVGVHAETLQDPTKPPAALIHGEAPAAGPALQSILIAPSHRFAVISGKTVTVGDNYEGAKVISIAENEVILQNGKSRQVMRLYPVLRKSATDGTSGSKTELPVQRK